jgi:signal transduction histidine kinase
MRDRSEKLEEELRQRAGELRDLARHLMAVREEEKARVARTLHDEMGSSLTAVNMDLMSVRQRLGEESALGERLARASSTLKSTVEGMRRIIEDLRPSMLESLGLREAVRSWAKDYAEQSRIPLTIDIPDEIPRLPPGGAIGLFRIVQEALTNAVRHAKASAISLSMRVERDHVVLAVVDDGVGIPPRPNGADRPAHGLLAMRERAIALGGTADIGSGPGGRGTEVKVTAPVEKIR